MSTEWTIEVGHTWDGCPLTSEERVEVRLIDEGDALRVEVSAPWHGDPFPEQKPGAVPGLWQYEVVEVFVAQADRPEVYTEIELGPGGHHLTLTFTEVRRADRTGVPIAFTSHRGQGRWRGEARILIADLPPRPWRVNAFAIHGEGEARRYLSWCPMPGDRPDFHQPGRYPRWGESMDPTMRAAPTSVAVAREEG